MNKFVAHLISFLFFSIIARTAASAEEFAHVGHAHFEVTKTAVTNQLRALFSERLIKLPDTQIEQLSRNIFKVSNSIATFEVLEKHVARKWHSISSDAQEHVMKCPYCYSNTSKLIGNTNLSGYLSGPLFDTLFLGDDMYFRLSEEGQLVAIEDNAKLSNISFATMWEENGSYFAVTHSDQKIIGLKTALDLNSGDSDDRGDVGDNYLGGVQLRNEPILMPEVSVLDSFDKSIELKSFKGKYLLVNFWATWCPPCVKELPSLERLQLAMGNNEFKVMAVSIDLAGMKVARKSYEKMGITELGLYLDSEASSFNMLGLRVVPSTLLIDRQGKIVGSVQGPLEWDDPMFVRNLKEFITNSSL